MGTAGPTYTGTGANFNDGGTTAWTNPTNIHLDGRDVLGRIQRRHVPAPPLLGVRFLDRGRCCR